MTLLLPEEQLMDVLPAWLHMCRLRLLDWRGIRILERLVCTAPDRQLGT
jgi:hypothetical protein